MAGSGWGLNKKKKKNLCQESLKLWNRDIWPCPKLFEEEVIGIEISERGRWLKAQPHSDLGING